MFGWFRDAAACASWRKREPKSGSRPYSGRRILTATSSTREALDPEALEVRPELRRQLRSLEGELDGRLQPAHRRAAVVARPLELVAVDGLLLHERLDRVRQLDLAPGAALGLLELVEDLRRQDVPADDR